MTEQTQASDTPTEAVAAAEAVPSPDAVVEVPPTPAAPVEDVAAAEAPAPEPYLEPSPLQQAEAVIEAVAQEIGSVVENAVDSVKSILHLGTHGEAAAQASSTEQPQQ